MLPAIGRAVTLTSQDQLLVLAVAWRLTTPAHTLQNADRPLSSTRAQSVEDVTYLLLSTLVWLSSQTSDTVPPAIPQSFTTLFHPADETIDPAFLPDVGSKFSWDGVGDGVETVHDVDDALGHRHGEVCCTFALCLSLPALESQEGIQIVDPPDQS